MKIYFKYFVIIFLVGAVALCSIIYTKHITQKNDMVLVLEWIDKEHDMINASSLEMEAYSKILFTKLVVIYSTGITGNDLYGDSKKGLCKIYHNPYVRDMLKNESLRLLNIYLEELWLSIKASFQSDTSICQLVKVNHNK